MIGTAILLISPGYLTCSYDPKFRVAPPFYGLVIVGGGACRRGRVTDVAGVETGEHSRADGDDASLIGKASE